jgi:hypothetical protein
MTSRARRKAMVAIVLFVLLWPLVHGVLVARLRVDPWELFGWAMYSLPAARVQVRVELERGGETEPLRAMGDDRRRLQAFARRRTALGALAPTAALARPWLEGDPTLDAVIVVTRTLALDRASSRIVAHEERHRHARTAAR